MLCRADCPPLHRSSGRAGQALSVLVVGKSEGFVAGRGELRDGAAPVTLGLVATGSLADRSELWKGGGEDRPVMHTS